jgi:hypothetical protein
VIVIIPQNDVVPGLAFRFLLPPRADFGLEGDVGSDAALKFF